MQYCFFQNNTSKTVLISLVLVGLIAVLPFLIPHHGVSTAFYSEWTSFVLGVMACFAFLQKDFWFRLEIPYPAIWLSAIAALIALQFLVTNQVYVAQALLPGIYIVWATALVILGHWIQRQLGIERSVTVLAWLLLIGGVLHTVVALVQYFDITGELAAIIDQKSVSTYGNIGQQNHFATQITLASFALIYLYAKNQLNRILVTTLLVSFALVLTASSSRAAAVYIIAGFMLTLIAYRITKTTIHHKLALGSGLLLVLFLIFQGLLPSLNEWLKLFLSAIGFDVHGLDTLVMLQRNAVGGVDVRLSEWQKAWKMFLESPLWGIGIGNYGWYSFNYQALPEFSAVPTGELFQHSHNLIMQVLAELGIAGLILLFYMASNWLRHILPHWRDPPYLLILVLVAVLFLHSNVEHPLWFAYFLGIAAVLFGLGSGQSLKVTFTPSLGQFTTGVTLALSAAILLITFWGFRDIIQVPRYLSATTSQQFFAKLHTVSKNSLLTPWVEVSMALYGVPDSGAIEKQLLLTTRVMRYRPNTHNVYQQIVYLALADRPAEASELMKKALIAYPWGLSKYACHWRRAPVEQIQRLWNEVENLTSAAKECQVGAKSRGGTS